MWYCGIVVDFVERSKTGFAKDEAWLVLMDSR